VYFGFQPADASHSGSRSRATFAFCFSPIPSSFPNLPTCQPSNRQSTPCLTPFPATHTPLSQIAENAATLSPAFATLTSRVKHNSCVCHSYRNHPGWGVPRRCMAQNFQPLHPPEHSRAARRRPHSTKSLSPAKSIATRHLASVDSKKLTLVLTLLNATLTKNQGGGSGTAPSPVCGVILLAVVCRVILPRMTALHLKLSSPRLPQAVSCQLLHGARTTDSR